MIYDKTLHYKSMQRYVDKYKQRSNDNHIDVEGDQVVDFFAEIKDNPDEFISTGVTID